MKKGWVSLLLALPIVLCSSCYSYQRMGYTSNPKEPTVDLGKIISDHCEIIYRTRLQCGRKLSIVAPGDLQIDKQKIRDTYNRMLKNLATVSSEKMNKNIQLVIVPSQEEPDNYIYKPPHRLFTDLVCLPDGPGNTTERVLCDLSTKEPHELFHEVSRSTMVKPGKLTCAGWFNEGMADYIAYLYPVSDCPPEIKPVLALKDFADYNIRGKLWGFCPGCEFHEVAEKLTKDEIKEFWRSIDQGYATAFGAFLYIEIKIGRKETLSVMRQMLGRHAYQDENFYRDLKHFIGFDIRNVSTARIENDIKKSRYTIKQHQHNRK